MGLNQFHRKFICLLAMKVGGGNNLQHRRLSMLPDRCHCHVVVIVHYPRSAHHCWLKSPLPPDFEPTQSNQQ
jgi:hypothetical protein